MVYISFVLRYLVFIVGLIYFLSSQNLLPIVNKWDWIKTDFFGRRESPHPQTHTYTQNAILILFFVVAFSEIKNCFKCFSCYVKKKLCSKKFQNKQTFSFFSVDFFLNLSSHISVVQWINTRLAILMYVLFYFSLWYSIQFEIEVARIKVNASFAFELW